MAMGFNPNRDKAKRFDSPEEYAAYLHAVHPDSKDLDYPEFYGDNFNNAIQLLESGYDKHLAAAEKLIEDMSEQQVFTKHLPLLTNSVVGFLPNVPAALAGQPKDMFMRAPSDYEHTQTPLTIYVETVVSAGVTHKQLVNRGIAILGFVLAMNAIRPVEVYTSSIGCPRGGRNGAYGSIVRIPSKPLDLMRATFMLVDPAYYRRLGFIAMRDQSGRPYAGIINWAWDGSPTSNQYINDMRKLLECEPQDVFITGGHLSDSLMLNNPIAWVKQMIEKHTEAANE